MQNNLVRQEIIPALHAMITRVIASSGLSSQDVSALISALYATDTQATDAANAVNLMTPKSTKLMVDGVLEAWSSLAPDALDTIAEIAEALNNDPDAFNTLKSAVDGLRSEIDGYGGLIPIAGNSAEGVALLSTNWINYESMPNGTYNLYVMGTAVSNSVELAIANDKMIYVTVNVYPYALLAEAGEENRKYVRWTARQGNVVIHREVDTLMGAGTNVDWSLSAGGSSTGGDADASGKLAPIDSLTVDDWITYVGLSNKDVGLYFASATGLTELQWLQFNKFKPDATYAEIVTCSITVTAINAGADKLVTFTVVTDTSGYLVIFNTETTKVTYVPFANALEVESSLDDLYSDIAGAFSLMGYEVGEVVSGMHNRTYTGTFPSAEQGQVKLAFTSDGEINVTANKDATYYWKPYGTAAISSDYQMRQVIASGTAGADTTVTSSYGPVSGAVISFDHVAASGTSGSLVSDITFRHVPTGKETVVRVTLLVDLS